MSSRLEYKGFIGTVNYCDIDKIYHGRVTGIPNKLISYHGDDLESLYADFVDSIDFYLLPNIDEPKSYIAPHAKRVSV